MKRISKVLVSLLMILSLVMFASCGKEKDNDDKDDKFPNIPGIGNDGGVETPIIPYE